LLGRTRALESHASRVRKKLCVDPSDTFVVNVWGVPRRVEAGVGLLREVASCLGSRHPERMAMRRGFWSFGHGLGTRRPVCVVPSVLSPAHSFGTLETSPAISGTP